MGICASCCEDTSDSLSPSRTATRTQIHRTQINEPDSDTKRQLQAEAAEKRLKELEGRGVTDPERLKRQQKKQEELERARDQMPANQEGGLRWTTD